MAEFQMVIRERNRMCKANKCVGCPLFVAIGNDFCDNWPYKHPLEAEKIIMEWAKKNPLMTNRMKFKEVFGFEFTDRVPESQYHSEWLDSEYEEVKTNG